MSLELGQGRVVGAIVVLVHVSEVGVVLWVPSVHLLALRSRAPFGIGSVISHGGGESKKSVEGQTRGREEAEIPEKKKYEIGRSAERHNCLSGSPPDYSAALHKGIDNL